MLQKKKAVGLICCINLEKCLHMMSVYTQMSGYVTRITVLNSDKLVDRLPTSPFHRLLLHF